MGGTRLFLVSNSSLPDGRAGIDAALVRRLIAGQFPQWSALPARPVGTDGHDNRTYRLGAELTVRLPTHATYAAAVHKENRWLPVLAPSLPLPVPVPMSVRAPARWVPVSVVGPAVVTGRTCVVFAHHGRAAFGDQLAEFLIALQRIDPTGGPPAGVDTFYRGSLTGALRRRDPPLSSYVARVVSTRPWQHRPGTLHCARHGRDRQSGFTAMSQRAISWSGTERSRRSSTSASSAWETPPATLSSRGTSCPVTPADASA